MTPRLIEPSNQRAVNMFAARNAYTLPGSIPLLRGFTARLDQPGRHDVKVRHY
jgi:hypothetical protein